MNFLFLLNNFFDFYSLNSNPKIFNSINEHINTYNNDGSWISNCFFNLFNIDDGIIYYIIDINVLIESCVFSYLISNHKGSGINFDNGNIVISNCCFFNCELTSSECGKSFFIQTNSNKIVKCLYTTLSFCSTNNAPYGYDSHMFYFCSPKINNFNSSFNFGHLYTSLSFCFIQSATVNFSTFSSSISRTCISLEYWGGDSLTEFSNIVNNSQLENINGIIFTNNGAITNFKHINIFQNKKIILFYINNANIQIDKCYSDDYSFVNQKPTFINTYSFFLTLNINHFKTIFCNINELTKNKIFNIRFLNLYFQFIYFSNYI